MRVGSPCPWIVVAGFVVALSGVALSGVSRGEDAAPAGEPTRAAATLAAAAKQILRDRCHDCHGGATTQADLVILDAKSLADSGGVVAGDAGASSIFERATTDDESTVMPKAPLPRLSYREIDVLRRWIEAGAPAFPDDVVKPTADGKVTSLESILKTILAHVESLPRADRPFIRYFSLMHLVAEGTTPENLAIHRDALAKAVNHLSRRRGIVRPKVIDPATGGLLAVDIRELGWDAAPFADSAATAADLRDVNLWDLALLDYPYGLAMPGNETFSRLAEAYLVPARLLRPVVFVRADWFVGIVTQPPLYEDFLRLPRTAAEVEKQLGVMSLDSGKRGGVTISGVSQNNRVVERHRSADGFYWKSVDFQSSTARENMFHDPVNLSGSGGEFIFSLPNGLQGYFLADAHGNRLAEAPTSIVTDSFAEDRVVRNGLACMRCHDKGMKRFTDVVRPSLERLGASIAFDYERALELYPPKEEMDRLLDEDGDTFMAALKQALGHEQTLEPLAPVSRRFLEEPVSLSRATAEAGLPELATLRELARIPHFATLGFVPLATGGQVQRDAWNDVFDEVVRQVGAAVPIVPIDGLGHGDYPTARPAVDVLLRTDKPGNVLRVGEKASLIVENRSDRKMFIELIGTDAEGLKVILTKPGTSVEPRQAHTIDLVVQPGQGRELVTVLASHMPLPPGRLLRGKHVSDRVVHDFYRLAVVDGRARIDADPAALGVVKRSIVVDTK